jgi:hypothetical protein
MPKHVIVANASCLTQPCYFVGYKDYGSSCEAHWTQDPWQARWIDTNEVKTEVALLTMLCPNYCLQSLPLGFSGASKAN